ncbi:hypothetical protein JTF08_13715 [Micrococcaceae bacterium RIT802]|nr:hypothetical protein [Micrococcaceae bacterium RIT 802]
MRQHKDPAKREADRLLLGLPRIGSMHLGIDFTGGGPVYPIVPDHFPNGIDLDREDPATADDTEDGQRSPDGDADPGHGG